MTAPGTPAIPVSGLETTGDQAAAAENTGILSALAGQHAGTGLKLYLPAGQIVIDPLELISGVWLVGQGALATRLILADGSDHDAISARTSADGSEANANRTGLMDLLLDGNAANQAAGHGVTLGHHPLWSETAGDRAQLPAYDDAFDPMHTLQNVMVINTFGDGFHIEGVSGTTLLACKTRATGGYGFHAQADTMLIGCDAGKSGLSGIVAAGSNIQASGCKSFWSGQQDLSEYRTDSYGFSVPAGARGNTFSACIAQDNWGPGVGLVHSSHTSFQGLCDSNGRSGSGSVVPAVDLYGATHSIIDVTCMQRDNGTPPGATQAHALRVRGGSVNNTVRITHASTTSTMTIGAPVMEIAPDSTANQIAVGASGGGLVAPAYTGTISPDPGVARTWAPPPLTGPVSVAAPPTAWPGAELVFILTQDAVGGRAVRWARGYANAPRVDPAPDGTTSVTFLWDGRRWVATATAGPTPGDNAP